MPKERPSWTRNSRPMERVLYRTFGLNPKRNRTGKPNILSPFCFLLSLVQTIVPTYGILRLHSTYCPSNPKASGRLCSTGFSISWLSFMDQYHRQNHAVNHPFSISPIWWVLVAIPSPQPPWPSAAAAPGTRHCRFRSQKIATSGSI